jgi:DNA-binding FrmR family transcriptional regulator
MTETKHQTHPEIVKRLKGAEGHIHKIISMLEGGRPCVDIAQQLQAVEKAVVNAKKALIHDHLHHCLEDAVGPGERSGGEALAEFREIAKYL